MSIYFSRKSENRLRELSQELFNGDPYKIFTEVEENSPEMKEYNELVIARQRYLAWTQKIIVGHCYYRKGDKGTKHFVSHKQPQTGIIEVQSQKYGLEYIPLTLFIEQFNL